MRSERPWTGGLVSDAGAPGEPVLTFVVVTLFEELFASFFETSLVGKAVGAGVLGRAFVDPRSFTSDVHRTVDDAPYGGGAGMVMKPEPLAAAIRQASRIAPAGSPRALLTPQGEPLGQARVVDLARGPGLVLVCGRYEGIDERVRALVDLELSIGDYVLSGGEVAAMVVMDGVSRLVPGVLGNEASTGEESFARGLLEYPQYTRPAEFEGREVPGVLRSGDHARIRDWRRAQALWRTRRRRPDLYEAAEISEEDERLMQAYPPLDP